MKKIEQRTEDFFGLGTPGAREGKRLEDVIFRMNLDGWKVNQIVPLGFYFNEYDGMDVTHGVILCTKIE